MTQEDKKLLLRDLSARLPYGVKCNINGEDIDIGFVGITSEIFPIKTGIGFSLNEDIIKPYLRPMSSMTEEEEQIRIIYERDIMSQGFGAVRIYMSRYIEWLDSKHFDWRTDGNGKTLIEKGLAIEAPEGMYDLKE